MIENARMHVAHAFVDLLPNTIEERTLYISIEYKTIVHLCLCGCKTKVVTPLSPTGWRMTFDGRTVSVYPSIGNWNLQCRSHYWIHKSGVLWSKPWTQAQIDAGFARDNELKLDYYRKGDAESTGKNATQSSEDLDFELEMLMWRERAKQK